MAQDVKYKIEHFFSDYRLRSYPKGKILILNGENPSLIYHLVKGTVKQYDVSSNGEEIIVNIFKPPAFFPMSLALNNTSNSYIYEAETDISVRVAPAVDVVAFVAANVDVLMDLLTRVYRGLDGVLGRMVELMSGSAKSRLMYELMLECHRSGKSAENGSCHLKISGKELAARTGLTHETVSRVLHKLVDSRLISLAGKQITIIKVKDLETALSKEI